MYGFNRQNPPAVGEFTLLLSSKMTASEEYLLQQIIANYPNFHVRSNQTTAPGTRSQSASASVSHDMEDDDDDDDDDEDDSEEASFKTRKIRDNGKKIVEGCKKWEY